MAKVSTLIVLSLVGLLFQEGCCVTRFTLKNEEVYTFQNVADLGFLTNPVGSDLVVTADWLNLPGQMWQVVKAFFSTTYLVKPVSDGLGAKVGIEAVRINGMMEVRKVPYSLGISNDLYWAVIPAEGSFYMLQNTDNNLCVETRGKGQPVFLSTCRLAKTQQWAVHARPRQH